MPSKLRASQMELLAAVDRLAAHKPERGDYGAAPAHVADDLGRKRFAVEESLSRLEDLGYVEPIHHSRISAIYVLTDSARDLLGGQDG